MRSLDLDALPLPQCPSPNTTPILTRPLLLFAFHHLLPFGHPKRQSPRSYSKAVGPFSRMVSGVWKFPGSPGVGAVQFLDPLDPILWEWNRSPHTSPPPPPMTLHTLRQSRVERCCSPWTEAAFTGRPKALPLAQDKLYGHDPGLSPSHALASILSPNPSRAQVAISRYR